jgi:asparagine synthase (glutamine-hydrolysing)
MSVTTSSCSAAGPISNSAFIAPVGGPLDDVDRRVQSREAPLLDTRDYLYAAFADAAADVGARVLLDGCGGELGLTYKGDGVFLEWLLRGDLVRLSRELRLASRQTGAALWPLIRSQLLRPLLPHPIRAGLRRRAFLPSAGIHALTPAFLAEQLGPEHTELGHLQERASRAYRSHRVVQSRLMDPARRLAGVQSHAGYARVERRFPLLDRRLLEFCLAAPAQLKIRDGYPRYLARGALAGVLPEQIRWRTSKEPLSPDYALRCNAQRGQAAAYLSEIGPRDPVRAVVDVQRLQRWATHEMTASRYSTPENLRAGFGVYQGIYLIAFLRQFPQFSA